MSLEPLILFVARCSCFFVAHHAQNPSTAMLALLLLCIQLFAFALATPFLICADYLVHLLEVTGGLRHRVALAISLLSTSVAYVTIFHALFGPNEWWVTTTTANKFWSGFMLDTSVVYHVEIVLCNNFLSASLALLRAAMVTILAFLVFTVRVHEASVIIFRNLSMAFCVALSLYLWFDDLNHADE